MHPFNVSALKNVLNKLNEKELALLTVYILSLPTDKTDKAKHIVEQLEKFINLKTQQYSNETK